MKDKFIIKGIKETLHTILDVFKILNHDLAKSFFTHKEYKVTFRRTIYKNTYSVDVWDGENPYNSLRVVSDNKVVMENFFLVVFRIEEMGYLYTTNESHG